MEISTILNFLINRDADFIIKTSKDKKQEAKTSAPELKTEENCIFRLDYYNFLLLQDHVFVFSENVFVWGEKMESQQNENCSSDDPDDHHHPAACFR